ncbi:MAG: hypothetical protein KKF44_09605 [Nanoarchaeota archaeon]|nr:hypothetical protein [Nanoarchaeota archaeon]
MELGERSFILFYLLSKYRFRNWSSNDIKRYQMKRARWIVKKAIDGSEFFREHYKAYDLDDFSSLPHVDKAIMMQNLSQYNTLGLNKEDMIDFALDVEKKKDYSKRYKGINIGMSSGTSGNKGIVITTQAEERYLKAMYVSRIVLPKKEKLNCAFILRVSSPAFNYNKFGNKLTYINQLQPIETIYDRLEKLDPNVISAPPSMLKLIAEGYSNKKLDIKPKILYSYAEVLYPDAKEYIESKFRCKVYQIYQGSEGSYAMTCNKGNLHINEDIVFFELFNQDGKPTPDGKPCYRLLVTDLHKTSQPIIRYDLNDILTLSTKKCSCGSNFRVIEHIHGRANDLFWGIRKNDRKKHFIYQDYISRAIITASDDIVDFQAIQEGFTKVTLRIKLNNKGDKEKIKNKLTDAIRDVFNGYGCKKPDVKVIFGEPRSNKRSNKLIRIVCNIKDIK